MRITAALLVAGLAGIAAPCTLAAQEAAPAPPLEVGALAPDFALRGATRHGVLQDSVRLSDYRGEVVVLAFFFRARTKG